ncbi:metallophosphoesterase [Caldimonas tepidiphila]|uniref:metallophosphoesterase n=1 Tax=Caldimonas tepidiphila TaxID=2315841 RepID=UPI000E5AD0FD|nr:metallophosphoesterase [Caldimonas tepidiphila]
MRSLLNPFILTVTAILATAYAYAAWRLTSSLAGALLLALPFLAIWVVPVVYWRRGREDDGRLDEIAHVASYLCMGWVNFLILVLLARDLLLLAAGPLSLPWLERMLVAGGAPLVFVLAFAALGLGALAALRGPRLRRVRVPVEGLSPSLEGLRIAQISDLHVGPTIGAAFVRRVVRMANRLEPDLTVLTGDIVDGPVERLAPGVAPLAELAAPRGVFLVMGNHDYYSGAAAWIPHFRSLGLKVLLNQAESFVRRGARVVVGGVVDPAVRLFDPRQSPRPELAAAPELGPAFRLLLAHNPQLAPLGERAGFDLQLSGHTHAGQFFPWTLAVRWVHMPHVAGLSRQGRMWVYVNPGTGSWGPPVRFGTTPELTLLELVRAPG